MYDLKIREDVVCYMSEATSGNDWNMRCNVVKGANDGCYPEFWFTAIVQSGLVNTVAARWGGSGEIEIVAL